MDGLYWWVGAFVVWAALSFPVALVIAAIAHDWARGIRAYWRNIRWWHEQTMAEKVEWYRTQIRLCREKGKDWRAIRRRLRPSCWRSVVYGWRLIWP